MASTNINGRIQYSRCRVKINNPRCSRKNPRSLSVAMITKIRSLGYDPDCQLDTTMRICESCRFVLRFNRCIPKTKRHSDTHKVSPDFDESQPSTSGPRMNDMLEEVASFPSLPSIPSADQLQGSHGVEMFNNIVQTLNVSPISFRDMRSMEYRARKSKEVTQAVRQSIFGLDSTDSKAEAFDEIIANLKDKFKSLTTAERSDKLKILSVLPQSWSANKISKDFDAPLYMVLQMKRLVADQGIFCTTTAKSGRPGISAAHKQKILDFFDDNDVSRPMPGTNDFVSEIRDGKREQVQKRLLMMSLKEAYKLFEENCSDIRIGFTLFTQLRPKHCILLDSTGTHNVCVCTVHENVKLIFNSIKIVSQTELTEKLLCSPQIRTTDCYFRTCEKCVCKENIEDELTSMLLDDDKEEVVFQQWLTTDRCNLETIVKPVDQFVPYLIEKIEKLLTHDFIHKKQSSFLQDKKKSLAQGEVIIICDFSENYAFIIQNAAQGYHWNNAQATIHPFEIYYKDENELKNVSFIIISEVLAHDTIAVQMFIATMIDFIKTFINVTKIVFMSDGAAAHYKNKKNFASMCCFKSLYGVDTEWHYFATAHGKGPCDAIGGTLKRMARRASLARECGSPITNPRQLYDWAVQQTNSKITKLNFHYISQEQYSQKAEELEELFNRVKTIPGTQKFHCFVPISENQIAAKRYSSSDEDPKIFHLFNRNK